MNITEFRYLISIGIDFYSLNLPQFYFWLRSYIKLSKQWLDTFPNTWKFVKNTPLSVVSSAFFSVFSSVAKHVLSWLMCYIHYSTLRLYLGSRQTWSMIQRVGYELFLFPTVTLINFCFDFKAKSITQWMLYLFTTLHAREAIHKSAQNREVLTCTGLLSPWVWAFSRLKGLC